MQLARYPLFLSFVRAWAYVLHTVPFPQASLAGARPLVLRTKRQYVRDVFFIVLNINSSGVYQDCQLFLQKHHLYWYFVVVPDLLWMELSIVRPSLMFSLLFLLMSPTSVFEYTYLLFWNVFWSLCPVIAIGLFDRIIGQ